MKIDINPQNLEGDIFKDYPYDPAYKISNKGRIKTASGFLTLQLSKFGYVKAGLPFEGKRKWWLVHRLVAICFIPNPNGKPFINHLDCIRHHNNSDNLEWCTSSENTIYAVKMGTHNTWNNEGRHGKNHPSSKSVNQIDVHGQVINTYGSVGEAARMIGCKPASIMDVIKGRKPTCKKSTWRYAS